MNTIKFTFLDYKSLFVKELLIFKPFELSFYSRQNPF